MECAETGIDLRCSPRAARRTSLGSAHPSNHSTSGARQMGRFIKLRAEDGFLSRGYLALPPAGRGPGIIVQQEVFGLNRQIRGICDLLAEEGYVVVTRFSSRSAHGRRMMGSGGRGISICPATFGAFQPSVLVADHTGPRSLIPRGAAAGSSGRDPNQPICPECRLARSTDASRRAAPWPPSDRAYRSPP
jgi:hypothetical protein